MSANAAFNMTRSFARRSFAIKPNQTSWSIGTVNITEFVPPSNGFILDPTLMRSMNMSASMSMSAVKNDLFEVEYYPTSKTNPQPSYVPTCIECGSVAGSCTPCRTGKGVRPGNGSTFEIVEIFPDRF